MNQCFSWVWSAMVCFLLHEGQLDRDLLLKADSERLQTSMPEAVFESTDFSTKWQRATIRPSPGLLGWKSPD